jgi:hypothetical protein
MTIDELFDKGVFVMTVEELILEMNLLLEDNLPDGKSIDDFTGGYVQQLKNNTKFVAYFGTKIGSTNKSTSSIVIEDDELDTMYMMLKAKIHDMRNSKAKVKKISLASRRLARLSDDEQPEEEVVYINSSKDQTEKPAEQVVSAGIKEEEVFSWS